APITSTAFTIPSILTVAVTTQQALVRNFCIIAHIDHGKSTLADRLLERTGSISQRDMQDQVLDTMDLERERGITIKLQAVRMTYPAKDGQTDELNLIDTPGHVDVADELSRALIFASHYDPSRGVTTSVRVVDGEILPRTRIRMMNTGKVHEVAEVGWFAPRPRQAERLTAGEVGYVTAAIKNVVDARVGDTITTAEHGATTPLPGYRQVKPMVFAGLFPTDSDQFADLKEALEKLQLNDGALSFEPENSAALGFGFRCGFLGLLHLEIVQERLEREFELDLITTAPT